MKSKGLYEKLIEYARRGKYPFHMPGHKRNGKFLECQDLDVWDIDITEIDGWDNLHDASGVIKESMDYASHVLGTERTWFLVGGSTCGVQAALQACCNIGDRVIVARNCHSAVYHAVENRNLKAEYIYPIYNEDLNLYGRVEPDELQEMLEKYPDAKAVIITSPT